MNARPIWVAQPGSQQLFLQCPIYEVALEGTRGGGKTDALLMDFAQHVGKGYGQFWRGILFRQSYPQLADVVAKASRWFPQIYPQARFNSSSYVWTWPTGEALFLRHMARADDYWNYHGHEYPWIGWEELTNWASSECFESMFSCSRSSRPGMPRSYRSTTNPFGRGHNWVKSRYSPMGTVIREPGKPERVAIHSSLWENAYLLDADPEYVQKLAGITNPNKRKAWLEGSWDVTSGGMLDDLWRIDVHALDPFTIPPSWRIDRAFDWGSSAPFSVGWWAESDGTECVLANGRRKTFPRGTLFLIAEWYGWTGKENEGLRMLAKDVAAGIKDRERDTGLKDRVRPGPADSSIFDTENGNSIAADMAAKAVHWTEADKSSGSRKHGWERIRTLLDNAVKGEGPGLFVFKTCRQWIRTVPVLPRDEDDPDDVDTEAEDHAGDMTRYRVYNGRKAMAKAELGGV